MTIPRAPHSIDRRDFNEAIRSHRPCARRRLRRVYSDRSDRHPNEPQRPRQPVGRVYGAQLQSGKFHRASCDTRDTNLYCHRRLDGQGLRRLEDFGGNRNCHARIDEYEEQFRWSVRSKTASRHLHDQDREVWLHDCDASEDCIRQPRVERTSHSNQTRRSNSSMQRSNMVVFTEPLRNMLAPWRCRILGMPGQALSIIGH